VQEGECKGDKVPGREGTCVCQQTRWLLSGLHGMWHIEGMGSALWGLLGDQSICRWVTQIYIFVF